jgi:hypothetical protein
MLNYFVNICFKKNTFANLHFVLLINKVTVYALRWLVPMREEVWLGDGLDEVGCGVVEQLNN